ncbi:MAG: hypothetical protein RLZZ127_676 [Planctomycetota bacterium]|jgi:hypothetical protein
MRFLATGILALAAALPAADPLPPGTVWGLHLDMGALLAGRSGAAVRAAAAGQPHAARLAMVRALTGSDPLADLRTVTVGGGERPESTVIVIRGRLDRERLETIALAAQDHRQVPAGARTIHAWTHEGRPAAGCLAAPDLLVLGGSVEHILSALAALDGGPAADLVIPAGWSGSAMVLASARDPGALGRGPESALLRATRGVSARLREDGDALTLDAVAEAGSEEQARRIQDGLKGLAALIALRPPEDMPAPLATALAAAEVERQGASVAARVRMPLDAAMALVAERLAAGPRPPARPGLGGTRPEDRGPGDDRRPPPPPRDEPR